MNTNRFFGIALLSLSIFFAGCSFPFGSADTQNASSSSSASNIAYIPTPNVTYVGTVRQSTDDSATYTLDVAKGNSIVLEAVDANMDLSRYVDRLVQLRGSVVPADDTLLMRVAEVTVLDEEASSSTDAAHACGGIAGLMCPAGEVCEDDPSDTCDPLQGGADCMGRCVQAITSSVPSSSALSSAQSAVHSSSKAAVSSVSISSTSSSSFSAVTGSISSADTTEMARQDYSAPLWTQRYCTSHIAFCIPVHKNWYFKSFGATTSNLWHVEFGMQSIDAMGMGAISLNLVDSTLEAAGATDGSVVQRGSDVIGFAAWNDGTHFELIGDASVRSAIEYMVTHITPYTLE